MDFGNKITILVKPNAKKSEIIQFDNENNIYNENLPIIHCSYDPHAKTEGFRAHILVGKFSELTIQADPYNPVSLL
tara:strand:- start:2892 stop:3119 length:228 start_codon:yes stop_codon:yes gene_type:complete